MQKYVALALFGVGLVLAGLAVALQHDPVPAFLASEHASTSAPSSVGQDRAPEAHAGIIAPVPTRGTTSVGALIEVSQPPAAPATASPDFLRASLAIGGRTFDLRFREGETLYEAMRRLERAGTITIEGRNFSGLGFFVEGLNGERNGGGKYWIYSVNGVKASVGVEGYRPNAGDRIVWTFEASY